MAIILFGMAQMAYPAYRILLNNGAEFLTEQYRISEGNVIFDDAGDTVTLPRNMVRIIDESVKEAPQTRKPESSDPKVAPGKDITAENASPADNSVKKPHKEASDILAYKKKNKQLKSVLNGALKQLRLSSQNRDEEGKEKARLELRDISAKIYELTDELKAKNGGVLPEDWWSGIEGPEDK